MEPMTDIKAKLNDAGTRLGEGASNVAEDLQTRAEDAWDSVQHRTDRAVRESSAFVRKNPVPTALVAFGFGLALGLFLKRHDPVSFKDRCIAEPLHQSRGVLLGVLIALGALLRRTFSSASRTTAEIAENVGDEWEDSLKPFKNAARQTGRRLGL